jgi:competence protein ComEA
LNSATAEQLDALPGIGPSKATLIVQYREAHGRFQTLEELKNVKGIGDKTYMKLAPLLQLN